MTSPSYLRSFLRSCLVLVFMAGCAAMPGQSSLASRNVIQKPAAPQTAAQMQAQRLLPPPGMVPGTAPNPYAAAQRSPLPVFAGRAKVAILLPLSGNNAALGQAMLNAAQLAVFDVADNRFELMPRDTGGNDTTAEAAARDALASGAQLLIGPVFATNVNRVKPIAATNSVSMLALSTDTSLADANVFVMGLAPGAQVERVIAYAHTHGVHNYAAIVPAGAYGDLAGDVLRAALARSGDTLVSLEHYDPAKHNSEEAVGRLAVMRDGIDALFVPAGGADLALIASQLSAAGFDNKHVHLIGTGLWDVPDLGHTPFLVGGWYAAPDPKARQNFLKSYAKAYGQQPPRIATLAYDSTALAALLARQGARFDRAALANPNGFAGVDGIFRLTGQGLVERGLAVLEVTPNGSRLLDAAPASFTGAAY